MIIYNADGSVALDSGTTAQVQALIDASTADLATTSEVDAAIAATLPPAPSTGDLQYWNGSAWVSLGIGSEGDILTVVSGVPAWVTPA